MADKELFGISEQLESDHVVDPNKMVGDLISRARAIEAVIKRDANCGIDSAEVLRSLPSVQPGKDIRAMCGECDAWNQYKNYSQPGWISCKGRLPEAYTDVLVWFEYFRYGDYNRLYQMYGIGNYCAKYDSWMINYETGWRKLRVLAWVPLPAEYREGGEK